MELDVPEGKSLYRVLAAAVVPRPIAWVSSTDGEVDNLAPFSFFNVISTSPPILGFAPADREDGLKDTPRNVKTTEEFVVNIVTMDVVESMNATSASVAPGESEFDAASIERAPSTVVTPPRVAAAKVAFECELYDFLDVGNASLILGRVVHVHIDDAVTTDGKLDVTKLDAVGRLSGGYYCSTDDRFELERPP